MGKGSQEYFQQINATLAGKESREAEQAVESAEESRALLQGTIGSGVYAGEGPMSAGEQKYAGQFGVDNAVMEAVGKHGWGYDGRMTRNWEANVTPWLNELRKGGAEVPRFANLQQFARYVSDYQNQQMDEVRRLEAEGDTEGAAALFDEISQLPSRLNPANAAVQGGAWEEAFGFTQDAEALAELHGRSTMGQIVDVQLQEGRDIMDRDSEASRAYRQSLTEGSSRAIAAQERGALRRARDFGLQRGSARSAQAAGQVAASTAREFAQMHAQVQAQAAQQYEGYRIALGQNAVAFANQWIDQAAGIRDEFSEMRVNLAQSSMQMFANLAGQNVEMWKQESMEDLARASRRSEMIGTAIGAVAGIASSAVSPG